MKKEGKPATGQVARPGKGKKRAAKKTVRQRKSVADAAKRRNEAGSAHDWADKRRAEIDAEYKEYAPDLEPDSGKDEKRCALTAMSLAHHGTEEALAALKRFREDPRAPGWIDCAIEECEMIHWQDTVGNRIGRAIGALYRAAQNIKAKLPGVDKETLAAALEIALAKGGSVCRRGQAVFLKMDGQVIGEDRAEFIIDDVLLAAVKPAFAEWLIRFREGREDKDLRQGDLENIEQGMYYDNEGKKLTEPRTLGESFNDFYERRFESILEMTDCQSGILLDFSGERIYGKFFSKPHADGIISDNCSGCCEECFAEMKCEAARDFKETEDKQRYRIIKRLMREIVEIETRIEKTIRPVNDLRYQLEVVERLKAEDKAKLKGVKSESEKRRLEGDLIDWDIEAAALSNLACHKSPAAEDRQRLKKLRRLYAEIKKEVVLPEYKNDVEGLEVYYGKAEPREDSDGYHDPLCECEDYESLSPEERMRGECDLYESDPDLLDKIPF